MTTDLRTIRTIVIILLMMTQAINGLQGANRRHYTTHDGLSNMAVLSLMQDNDGYMWVATCDGVDVIENSRIRNFGVGNNGRNEFSGNLVEWMQQDQDGVYWVHTNYGLDRYDPRANRVDYFRQINGSYRDALSPDGDLVVITSADSLLFCGRGELEFKNLGKSQFHLPDVKLMRFDDDNTLTVVTLNGFYKAIVKGDEENLQFRQILKDGVRSARLVEGRLFYLTDGFELREYDFSTGTTNGIYQFGEDLRQRGELSSIAIDGDGYVLGFKTNGVVRLYPQRNGEMKIEPLDIESGIFCLYRDRNQDILWVGTDGDGVYCYSKDAYDFYSETRTRAGRYISKPVRSLFKDAEGSVWIGTKGDGVYCYRNFQPEMKEVEAIHYTYLNSALPDNEIYAFAGSSRPLFWIGGQGWGLSYYSYTDHKIHYLDVPSGSRLQSIHGIYEADPNTLYIATVGEGALKVSLEGDEAHPVIKSITKVIYDQEHPDANTFFSVTPQGDIIWFGNRGYGAFRYDLRNGGKVTQVDLSTIMPVANDVFDIYVADGEGKEIYCATSAGLIELTADDKGGFVFKEIPTPGTGARTLHAILGGRKGEMLASTNSGIVRYRLDGLGYTLYSSGTDFSIMQFNDGAAYRDSTTGTLYFGGANGFVVAVPSGGGDYAYAPEVKLRSMIIDNEEIPGVAALGADGKLVLEYDRNNFKLLFAVADYLNGAHYQYRYRLLGASDKWVDCADGEVTFNNISHGNYVLEVAYSCDGKWSEPYMMPIEIRPPFYASTAAYVIYAILLVAIVIGLLMMTVRYQQRKRSRIVKEMERKGMEDVYEAKLRFFTNITHELFTPLTLINGACERMLGDNDDKQRNLKLTRSIHKNSTRLIELIQELIEFRRIDTDHRQPDVEMLPVSEITADAVDNFSILADRRELNLKADIIPGMEWPSDRSGFVTIVNNLLSNALKYTPKGGEIRLQLRRDGENLIFQVANTGEGIAPENLGKIFDRYKVLERFERLSAEGTIKRNGLGLAVCDGLARLLGGSITVESTQGEWTTFTVTLPEIEVTRSIKSTDNIHYEKPADVDDVDQDEPLKRDDKDSDKTVDANSPLVFVVDDEKEMLSFISDTLSTDYRVKTFIDASKALEALAVEWPDAIVCDILMEGMNGIEFVGKVKSMKTTSHIPIVQLSSLHSEEDKIKSLTAGADVYVTKPFKMGYLRTVVDGVIKRKEKLKEYFDSSLSSFSKIEGQILHSEDRQFLGQLIGIIEENIANPDLDTKFVADKLGCSVRNLYRRVESVTNRTPNTIIKDTRLETARKMLAHTNLSIDELIYKSGFTNRGTFFKQFQQKYGCTPKQYRDQGLSSAKSDETAMEKQ